MDVGSNGNEMTVVGPPSPLQFNYLMPNGGHESSMLVLDLQETGAGATENYEDGTPPRQIQTQSGPTVTMESIMSDIVALWQAVQEINNAHMPPEPIQPSAKSEHDGSPSNYQRELNLSPKEKKRLAKNAYSKRYRESMKAQPKRLRRETSFYKQYLAKIYEIFKRFDICEANLDGVQALVAAQVGSTQATF